MNDNQMMDVYVDFLISSFGQATGTGLSRLLDGMISHDQVQRFLARPIRDGRDLWRVVKPYVREIECDDGVLIVDDSISEKPHTDENEIICWHYDHTSGQVIKGINFITVLYHAGEVSLPVGFHLVAKTESYYDAKSGKEKRRSTVKKNEVYREMLRQALLNHILFQYVLSDSWYASAKNMVFIKHEMERDFVMPLKSNQRVALSVADKKQGRTQRIDTLQSEPKTVTTVYLKGVDFPLHQITQIFTNEDGSTGVQYLVTSDLELDYDQIVTIYQKRWKVEPYHKSLKQNASLAKSPTRTVTTQSNHFFAALCAYVKLETLKMKCHLNHAALKARLYLCANRAAFDEWQRLQAAPLTA